MITWVKLQAPGWNTDGEKGILPIMNEVYNIFRRIEAEQNVMVTDGELPTLATEANKFQYLMPDNIWRVSKVGFAMPYYCGYVTKKQRQTPDEFFYFAGRKYLEFKHLRTFDKSLQKNARVEFTVNPGDTPVSDSEPSNWFIYIGYKEAEPQLLSVNVEPDLPENLHPYLVEGTLKVIEAMNNGNYVDAYQYIHNVLKAEVNAQLNLGEQGLSGHVERREF